MRVELPSGRHTCSGLPLIPPNSWIKEESSQSITSTSAWHSGHHVTTVRPLRTINVLSVSIVILVVLVIMAALGGGRPLGAGR